MADTTADARRQVGDARQAADNELDMLGASARASLDIPAKIKHNPVRTVGIASGAAFLLLGGPKRLVKAVGARVLPDRFQSRRSLLPTEIQHIVDKLEPEERDQVERHLERDFAAYLEHAHPREPYNARREFWKTYDQIIGVVGARAGRQLAKRLFDPDSDSTDGR